MWKFGYPNDASSLKQVLKLSLYESGCSGDDYQPLNLDLSTQEWLTAGGVRRVCAGHLSLGYDDWLDCSIHTWTRLFWSSEGLRKTF